MKSRRRIAASRPDSNQLHQEFGAGETGSNDQFALHKSRTAHVRFGSKADIPQCPSHVRFTPNSGHWRCSKTNARLPCVTEHALLLMSIGYPGKLIR